MMQISRPDVSFLVASFNSSAFLEDSVATALAQKGVAVEIIIVDDGSGDDSLALAHRLAADDPRIHVTTTTQNGGPGAARNVAIGMATGQWLTILDSDDLIHPDRSRLLIDLAEKGGADLVADNLLVFENNGPGAELFSPTGKSGTTANIPLAKYLRQTVMYKSKANLGFLKPMIRRAFLEQHSIGYDERLRIAEDDDLIIRCLLAGGRYELCSAPLYFYRKHGTSISHRLSSADADKMVASAERLGPNIDAFAGLKDDPAISAAWKGRVSAVRNSAQFAHFIDAAKSHQIARALSILLRNPGTIPLLRMPISARVSKLLRGWKSLPVAPPVKSVLIVSRQRLIGATNGSSAYLLTIATAIHDAGYAVHLVQPSPALFGRTPFIRLRPEMGRFASHAIRKSKRIGSWILTTDIGVWRAAISGATTRVLNRLGVSKAAEVKAPYAIAVPWTLDESLFVAQHRLRKPSAILLDYVFQTEALPYIFEPGTKSAIIMHDLFHARAEHFAAQGTSDSVAMLGFDEEVARLGKTSAVIAIQKQEADFVAQHCPGSDVILAPIGASPVATRQPGNGNRLLFVGSNTAPNVNGIKWFLDHVWPSAVTNNPQLVLDIAGRVSDELPMTLPAGVNRLGLVPDLAPVYAAAGIVISPLNEGSGLKIKLIEALAMGKACVVSPVTLQGVEDVVGDAVICASDAEGYIDAIAKLSSDEDARSDLAGRALDTARSHFSAEACYGDLIRWIDNEGSD